MTTVLQSHVEEPGKIVISAKLFGDIVRRLPNDQVTISVDDNNRMTIVSGESTFTITGIPAEEYPDLPTVHDEDAITVPQGMLKNMIRQTIFAVAENDAKPIHTGTLFEPVSYTHLQMPFRRYHPLLLLLSSTVKRSFIQHLIFSSFSFGCCLPFPDSAHSRR